MSSILRKVDQAINPDQREYASGPGMGQPTSGTNVPRGANTGAYADPAYAGNNNYNAGGLHHTGNQAASYGRNLPGPAPNTAGPHRSDLLNKLDPRVDSDMSNPQTRAAHAAAMGNLPGPAPNTAGPHRSDLLNKLDPTVDSDLSTGRGAGTGGLRTGGMRAGAYEAPISATAATSGAKMANAPEGTYGPHRSRLANALDPRVDSDADGRHHGGAPAGYNQQAYMSGGAAPPGSVPEGTYGPHRSRIANAIDPRMDSDADSRRYAGAHAAHDQQVYAGGPAGGSTAEGTYGPHRSALLNKLDPKVDSRTGQVKPPKHI
jgi:hypothetical protein